MNNKTSDLNNNFTRDGQERRKIEVMLGKLVAINLGKATAGPEEKINEKKHESKMVIRPPTFSSQMFMEAGTECSQPNKSWICQNLSSKREKKIPFSAKSEHDLFC